MPALREARYSRGIPEFYASSPSTAPGIAVDPPRIKRTDIGSAAEVDIPFSEQLRFLSDYTEWLALPLLSRRQSTGSGILIFLPVAEASSQKSSPIRHTPLPTLQDQIASIRSSLSLQMKEIAQALGVERPTVYSWLNERNTPHAGNRERLRALYGIAEFWNRLSRDPLGKALHETDADGKSVFSLLIESSLPIPSLRARLGQAAKQAAAVASRRGVSVRELAAKHGIDLRRVVDRQDDIDLETGKGVLPE